MAKTIDPAKKNVFGKGQTTVFLQTGDPAGRFVYPADSPTDT
jgi:hypothetical protein